MPIQPSLNGLPIHRHSANRATRESAELSTVRSGSRWNRYGFSGLPNETGSRRFWRCELRVTRKVEPKVAEVFSGKPR